MDLVSLQPGHSQNLPAGHQLSTADSATSVRSVFDPATPGLPDKTIAQRWCIVDRPGGTHSAESDSDYVDARADINNSDDEYLNALDHPWPTTSDQQQPEPQTSHGDGPWQVVTRRRSGRKQQQSAAGKGGDARVKKGTRKKGTSARQLPENSSAGNGGCGQNKPVGNAPVTLLPITSCWYWPLCIRSFAQLCKVDWVSFHTRLMKLPECEGIRTSSLSCDSGVCRHGADSPDASKHSSGRFRPPSQFSLSDRSALPGRSTAHQRRPIALPDNPETGCPGSRPERTEGGGPASENCWLAEELRG